MTASLHNWVNMDEESTPASELDAKTSENTEKSPECKQSKDGNVDSELDDLLESALEDFDKSPLPTEVPAAEVNSISGNASSTEDGPVGKPKADQAAASSSASAAAAAGGSSQTEQEKLFEQIFNSVQMGPDQAGAQAQFEGMMKALMAEEPQMTEHFQNLTEAVKTAETDPESSEEMLQNTIHQALGGLAQNAQNIQSEMSEDDLIRMMSEMNFEGETGADGDQPPFLPMMQGMMKSLLSREVLYPSLKEITTKYPEWLETNKEKIDSRQYEDYRKQFELMKQICTEFESEEASDTEQRKQQRFDKIMDFMQQMQAYGQPPQEIVGEMAPGLEFDSSGMPKFPGNPEQCSLM